MSDNRTTEPNWTFYRNGELVPITEDEARRQLDCWHHLSDDRGMATVLFDQMWTEIDRLRKVNGVLRDEITRMRSAGLDACGLIRQAVSIHTEDAMAKAGLQDG